MKMIGTFRSGITEILNSNSTATATRAKSFRSRLQSLLSKSGSLKSVCHRDEIKDINNTIIVNVLFAIPHFTEP